MSSSEASAETIFKIQTKSRENKISFNITPDSTITNHSPTWPA